MYGIPNMKLDKSVVLRRVDLLKAEGIEFVTGVEIGKDIAADELKSKYDAVILATGATKARDLPSEGRNLDGIYFAVDFLKANTKSLLDSDLKDGAYISAKGKNVVVIGGGDTGTDCVGTSIRHGCKSVIQLEVMPKPPIDRAPNNPWPEWPKIYRVDYGQEEAEALYGDDPRQYLTTAQKFIGDENGKLKAIQICKIEWVKDDSGRMTFKPVPGTEETRDVDIDLGSRARCPLQCESRIRQVRHQRPRRVRGRRCSQGTVSRGVGYR
jgi:glutamate synthase (NADPH/NADH) small chain